MYGGFWLIKRRAIVFKMDVWSKAVRADDRAALDPRRNHEARDADARGRKHLGRGLGRRNRRLRQLTAPLVGQSEVSKGARRPTLAHKVGTRPLLLPTWIVVDTRRPLA